MEEIKVSNKLKDRKRKMLDRNSRCEEIKRKYCLQDRKRKYCKRHPLKILDWINLFKTTVAVSPEYICTICCRCLYKDSYCTFKPQCELSQMLNTNVKSRDQKIYICCTCKRFIKTNKIPPQAQFNAMSLPETPEELWDLIDFECRLLAKRYPFMKIVQCPRGRQKGIIGQVINVPLDAEAVCAKLPRTSTSAGIIPVKLKRRKAFKGHVTITSTQMK